MMRKCRMPVVLFLLAVFAPTSALGFGIEGAVGGWHQSPRGQLSYKALTIDDELDLKDDLNYDDKTRPFGRLKIDMPLFFPNIYLMYTPMKFEGVGEKEFSFNFGDDTIIANEPFESKLVADHFEVGLYYSFFEELTADILSFEVGLNARILRLEAEIKQEASGVSESEKGTVPVPMLYLGLLIRPVKWLALEGEGRGLAYSGDAYYSLIGRVRVNFWGPLFVTGGYRYDKLKYEDDDLNIDINIGGPFAELGFAF